MKGEMLKEIMDVRGWGISLDTVDGYEGGC